MDKNNSSVDKRKSCSNYWTEVSEEKRRIMKRTFGNGRGSHIEGVERLPIFDGQT